MSRMFLKSVGLLSIVVIAVGVCDRCETDPLVELDQPTAQVNGGTVTITVDGEEGWSTNNPPYHAYTLFAAVHRIHDGQPTEYPEIMQDDPNWAYGATASCGLSGAVQRDHAPFTITFSNVPYVAGDSYYVHVRSNEGEGFDPLYVTSVQVAP